MVRSRQREEVCELVLWWTRPGLPNYRELSRIGGQFRKKRRRNRRVLVGNPTLTLDYLGQASGQFRNRKGPTLADLFSRNAAWLRPGSRSGWTLVRNVRRYAPKKLLPFHFPWNGGTNVDSKPTLYPTSFAQSTKNPEKQRKLFRIRRIPADRGPTPFAAARQSR